MGKPRKQKKIGGSTRNYYYGFTLDEFMGSTGNGVLIYLASYLRMNIRLQGQIFRRPS